LLFLPSFSSFSSYPKFSSHPQNFPKPRKKIFHGIYIHDFGSGRPIPDCRNCVPMEVFRKSVETVCEQTCSGILDGIILPQAAYFSFPSHREHVKFLKEYVDWADGTMTEL